MKPSQLTINGTEYPFSSHDNYKAYLVDMSESERMADDSLTTEIRGRHWVVEYSYDKLPDSVFRAAMADLRTAQNVTVTFAPPESDIPITREMRCTKWPQPGVAFYNRGRMRWHKTAFILEAVEAEEYA